MNFMHSFGPAADPITVLAWGFTVVCILVVVVVGGLLITASLRARAVSVPLAGLPITATPGGLRWIYVGTAASTVLLFGLVIWTMFTLAAIASPPAPPAFAIEIRAHQWWWEARYLSDSPDRTFVTANELHIPVGRPVQLRLIGDDVIHSFWIPELAGKTDVIPGQTNLAWLEADRPGTYRGQCSEFCGVQHAHMSEFVIAEPAADFERWRRRQLADAAPPSAATARGAAVFLDRCAACHTVRGAGAGGILGPDLTHVMARHGLGAGAVTNDRPSLRAWINDAQAAKPGARMPTLDLHQNELDAVTDYVETLD